MFEFVRDHVSQEELLAQLAEEAIELAHAALKLRRAYGETNPTPTTRHEAFDNLREELADVYLVLDVLDLPIGALSKIQHQKLSRWVKRLEKAVNNNAGKDDA